MTDHLLENPNVVPRSVYTRARSAAAEAIRPFGNMDYEAIYALADVTTEALAGLGMTKYVFLHRVNLLPAWHSNFPSFDPTRPTMEDALSVALTIARECPSVLVDGGKLGALASAQAARAIVVSLYAQGELLVSYSDPFAHLPEPAAQVASKPEPESIPDAPLSLTEKIFGIR